MIYQLNEDSRTKLLSKSKSSVKGRQRFNRRNKSKVANSVRQFNSIDMNKLFKQDILTVNILVNGETDNYTVRISFGGFLEILRDQIERNNGLLNLRAITRALLIGFNKDDVYINCSCLHPSTEIKLLDGRVVDMPTMKKLFDSGETLYVYSTDENGDFKPGLVEKVWITKQTKDFIKVTLDSGEEILTTPDHLYMLRDGSYQMAENLIVGQSLMPMYFSDKNGYETVKFNSTGKYHSTYKVVANELKSTLIEEASIRAQEQQDKGMKYDVAIHHKDYNKSNNHPDNLDVMTAWEHWEYHFKTIRRLWDDEDFRERSSKKASEHMKQLNANPTTKMLLAREQFLKKGAAHNYDPEWKPIQSEIMHRVIQDYWDNLTPEEYQKRCEQISYINNLPEVREKRSKSLKDYWKNLSEKDYQTRCDKARASNEGLKDIQSKKRHEYWANLSDEDRKNHIEKNRINSKKAADKIRGTKLSEEHKDKIRNSKLRRTQEQIESQNEKILLTKIKNTLLKIISEKGIINEENYLKYRAKGVPHYNKRFSSIDEAVSYFELNHKIVKIERLQLEETPVYDIKVKDWHNFVVNSGIVLHNCPDFHYRFGYWATRNKINSGVSETRPSKITNPTDSLGSGCKHILLVLNNNSWLIKVASVINNYIKYMEKHFQKAYSDIIYPAIYGKDYEEPVQLSFDDTDNLAGEEDIEILDTANEYGKKSTQFQKGNTQGVRFAKNNVEIDDQMSLFDDEEV